MLLSLPTDFITDFTTDFTTVTTQATSFALQSLPCAVASSSLQASEINCESAGEVQVGGGLSGVYGGISGVYGCAQAGGRPTGVIQSSVMRTLDALLGAHFTCFTGTQMQLLAQKALRC